jgi:hypothetical protein
MIEKYSFGKIVVNGVTYTDDIKIIKGNVVSDWWRKRGHQVGMDDVKDILDSDTDILVIGTGKFSLVKLTSPLREHLKSHGIELIEKNTSESTKVFNQLHRKGRKVSAGFHLTC